ncbi:hypothetical protein [Gemmatimonas sp.]|jgi:hypothetical protein|uniref:hypothetical protein n=1 Tax=Gemmatimonas sp. TaxID=1962908 RepID=UPI0022CB78D3|nr:hypothetical protein [Gemmatimonas sp.]MCZ8204453.1 hypothetical protein [Gemmatimonas sp.]
MADRPLTPRHRHRACIAGLLLLLAVSPGRGGAQARDSVRTAADSARAAAAPAVRAPNAAAPAPVVRPRGQFTPPLTPRRAFVYSAILPGLGQSRLDRGSSGALFAAVELAALVMVRRSSADLREARRFLADSLPLEFTVSGTGTVQRSGILSSRYDDDLIRTRRLHVEDWLAVVAFNHLFAGADAFVSAQLWDLPIRLSAAPTANGPLFVATLRF